MKTISENINPPELYNNEKINLYSYIPARYVFIFLSCLGFMLLFAYKVALSVAIVAMVGHSSNGSSSSLECKPENSTNINSTIDIKEGQFNWDSDQQSLLLGAFFYGYAATQLPGGLIAQNYGAKWILGLSILITAILSLIGPICAEWGFVAFFATRVGQGLTEGLILPAQTAMFARWLPKMERSLGYTIVLTGGQIGTVVTLPLTGYLCDGKFMGGWPAIFYLTGIAGCVWFVCWAILIHERPDSHPYITFNELDYIRKGQGEERVSQRPTTPWYEISKSIPMWALIITHFGNNWGFLTILTLLPTYFQKILLLDIKKNGLMSSLPWLVSALMSYIAGYVSDKVRSTQRVSINIIRKVCNTIGFIGPAICLIAVVLSKCDSNKSIIFFIIAMGLNGISWSGFLCTHVDMSPDFAGTLMGITNTVANIPGFVSPMVANAITKNNQTLSNWSYVFYLSAGVYIITSIVYVFFASAKLQKWGISINKI